MITYRLHQIDRDGTEWTSTVAFAAATQAHVSQAIRAGYLSGAPRWATEEHTGRFLTGLDASGRPLARSPRSRQSCTLGDGRAIYAPAVRVYAPSADLQRVLVRGMAAIELLFAGSECVGWTERERGV